MSTSVIVIIAGVVIILAGLAKMGRSQNGVFNLRNFGINIRSNNTQYNKVGNIESNVEQPPKLDWVGLATVCLGFLTAVVGLFKG